MNLDKEYDNGSSENPDINDGVKRLSEKMYIPLGISGKNSETNINTEAGCFIYELFREVYATLDAFGLNPVDFFEKAWAEYGENKLSKEYSPYSFGCEKCMYDNNGFEDFNYDKNCDCWSVNPADKGLDFRILFYFGILPDGYNIYNAQTPIASIFVEHQTLLQMYKTIKKGISEGRMDKSQLIGVEKSLISYNLYLKDQKTKQFDRFRDKILALDDNPHKEGLLGVLDVVHRFYYERIDDNLPEEVYQKICDIKQKQFDSMENVSGNCPVTPKTSYANLKETTIRGESIWVPRKRPVATDTPDAVGETYEVEIISTDDMSLPVVPKRITSGRKMVCGGA